MDYLTVGGDAANLKFQVVNEHYLHRRPMLFTTTKPLAAWGLVLHDPDLAEAILDRVLERGRLVEHAAHRIVPGTSSLLNHTGVPREKWPECPESSGQTSRNPQRVLDGLPRQWGDAVRSGQRGRKTSRWRSGTALQRRPAH